MNDRYLSVVLVVFLMAVSMAVVLPPDLDTTSKATAPHSGLPAPNQMGQRYVNIVDTLVYHNGSITSGFQWLNDGDITVLPGGHLIFNNITVLMSNNTMGHSFLNVSEGGIVEFHNSTLNIDTMYVPSVMAVNVDGLLVAENSTFLNLSFDPYSGGSFGGIYARGNGTIILDNCTFDDDFTALTIMDNSHAMVKNTKISNGSYGVVVVNSTSLPEIYGLSVVNTNYEFLITDCTAVSVDSRLYQGLDVWLHNSIDITAWDMGFVGCDLFLDSREMAINMVSFHDANVTLANTSIRVLWPDQPVAGGPMGGSVWFDACRSVSITNSSIYGLFINDSTPENDGIILTNGSSLSIQDTIIENGTVGIQGLDPGPVWAGNTTLLNLTVAGMLFTGQSSGPMTLTGGNYSMVPKPVVLRAFTAPYDVNIEGQSNVIVEDNLTMAGGGLYVNDTYLVLDTNASKTCAIVAHTSGVRMSNLTAMGMSNETGIVAENSTLVIDNATLMDLSLLRPSAAVWARASEVRMSRSLIQTPECGLYFDGAEAGVDLYLDQVSVINALRGVVVTGTVGEIRGGVNTQGTTSEALVLENAMFRKGSVTLSAGKAALSYCVTVPEGTHLYADGGELTMNSTSDLTVRGKMTANATIVEGDGNISLFNYSALDTQGPSGLYGLNIHMYDNATIRIEGDDVWLPGRLSMYGKSTIFIEDSDNFTPAIVELNDNSTLTAYNTSIGDLNITANGSARAEEWNYISIQVVNETLVKVDAEVSIWVEGTLFYGPQAIDNGTIGMYLPAILVNSTGMSHLNVTITVKAPGYTDLDNVTLNTSTPGLVVLRMEKVVPYLPSPPGFVFMNLTPPAGPGAMGYVELTIGDADISAIGDAVTVSVSTDVDYMLVGDYPDYIVYFIAPYTPGHYSLTLALTDLYNLTNSTTVSFDVEGNDTMGDFGVNGGVGGVYPGAFGLQDGLETGTATLISYTHTTSTLGSQLSSGDRVAMNSSSDEMVVLDSYRLRAEGGMIADTGVLWDIWSPDPVPEQGYGGYGDALSFDVGHVYALHWTNGTYAKLMVLEGGSILSPSTRAPLYGTSFNEPIGYYVTFVFVHQPNGSRYFSSHPPPWGVIQRRFSINITDKTHTQVFISAMVVGNGTLRAVPTAPSQEHISRLPQGRTIIGEMLDVYVEGGSGTITWMNITLHIDPENLRNISPDSVALYWYDEGRLEWVRVNKTNFDPESGTVWGNVTHNTIFAALGSAISGSLGGGGGEAEGGGGGSVPLWTLVLLVVVVLIPPILVYLAVVRRKRPFDQGGEGEEGRGVTEGEDKGGEAEALHGEGMDAGEVDWGGGDNGEWEVEGVEPSDIWEEESGEGEDWGEGDSNEGGWNVVEGVEGVDDVEGLEDADAVEDGDAEPVEDGGEAGYERGQKESGSDAKVGVGEAIEAYTSIAGVEEDIIEEEVVSAGKDGYGEEGKGDEDMEDLWSDDDWDTEGFSEV